MDAVVAGKETLAGTKVKAFLSLSISSERLRQCGGAVELYNLHAFLIHTLPC